MIGAETKIGDRFRGRPKAMTLSRLLAFSGGPLAEPGWPKRNIHTDEAFARSTGLPGVCAAGTQYQAHLVELMVDLFGETWLAGGSMAVKMVDLVMAGDSVTANAEVTNVEREGESRVVHFDVWSERQDGAKVLVGTASGRLPG
jgi:acyl dehydratase